MRRKWIFTTEAELAATVVQWLDDQDWEIYQEVQPGVYGGNVADIVATRGPVMAVVECKLSFGLRVIEQAYGWKDYATLVYVAVPESLRSKDLRFGFQVCRSFGVGILTVHEQPGQYQTYPYHKSLVEESVRPSWNRKPLFQYLRSALNEQQKTFAAAGNANGSRWTPFKQTCLNLQSYAKEHPGCSLKDAIDNVKTHYSTPTSARASITKWIDQGLVPELRIERLGRAVRLWPT